MKNYKIAVAGTGYVGLSIATLLSQHHQVTAVDIVPENVELMKKDIDDVIDYYITYKGSKKTSMLEDIMNNRKTENEYLAGDLIRLAEKHGVSTPMIKTLYYLIKIREEQYLER